jgi:hypothetical protein
MVASPRRSSDDRLNAACTDQSHDASRLLVVVLIVAMVLIPISVAAQDHRYVEGDVDVANQSQSDSSSLGGTTWGARAALGEWLSPRVALELESVFTGSYSRQY